MVSDVLRLGFALGDQFEIVVIQPVSQAATFADVTGDFFIGHVVPLGEIRRRRRRD